MFTLAYIFVASEFDVSMKSPIVLSENPASTRRCTHVPERIRTPARHFCFSFAEVQLRPQPKRPHMTAARMERRLQ